MSSAATSMDYNQLVRDGKARVSLVKEKIPVTADEFASDEAKSSVPDKEPVLGGLTLEVDDTGRLHIILPPDLLYSQTRAKSERVRNITCSSTDSADGFIMHDDTGKPIPVTFRMRGLNLYATRR